MNFLSHYYLDSQSEDPYFILGIALPDLWKGFSGIYNSTIRHDQHEYSDDPEMASLSAGITQHFLVDQIFHNSSLFDENVAYIKKKLIDQHLPSFHRRIYFFAHILFEMMLDRQIILDDKMVVESYYDLLKVPKSEKIQQFTDLHDITSRSASFFRNLKSFRENKYLYHYAEVDGLIYGLNRVHLMINKSEITSVDQKKLGRVILEIDQNMKHNWQNTFKLVKDQMDTND